MRTRRLSYGRGTGPYIRARSGAAKLPDGLVKQGAKSEWDRITAPRLADCGRCLRLGEVRVECLLARSLSARRWEADRCVHKPCHQARDHSELMIPGKHECKGLVCGWARLVGP